MSKFKVGDRVKIIHPKHNGEIHMNQTGVIIVDDESEVPYKIQFDDGDTSWMYPENLKLTESLTQKAKKTMSSIIKKIKDIKLSQDDRLLRKHDFENDNGEMMEEARDLMLDEILAEKWATRRLEIAADLKLVEQSEK